MSIRELLDRLQQQGLFSQWGYCENPNAKTFDHYTQWLKDDYQGPLHYLEGERAKQRKSLQSFFDQYQSSLVFTFSYAHAAHYLQQFYNSSLSNDLKIGAYALAFSGEDYHHYLKRKLESIFQQMAAFDPELEFKLSLDIHPVLERDLAVRSGLGWFGKNSMFITKEHGSFLMIGSILLSKKLELTVNSVVTDHCGSCTACISSCPTNAILGNRMIDASKCISTFTIEQFKDDAIAPLGMENANGEIFGCDICQVVCPWNKKVFKIFDKSEANKESESMAMGLLSDFLHKEGEQLISELQQMSNREFRRRFLGTPLERTGRIGMLKNLNFWKQSGLF